MQGDKLFPTDLRGAEEEKGILSYPNPHIPRIQQVTVGMESHGHANKVGGHQDVPPVVSVLQVGAIKPLKEKRIVFFLAATLHLYNAAKMLKVKSRVEKQRITRQHRHWWKV